MRPEIVLSDAAVSDILEQAAWYQEKSGAKLASRWEGAVTSILLKIAKNPTTGAPCNFKAIELEGVRRMAVPRFPTEGANSQIGQATVPGYALVSW